MASIVIGVIVIAVIIAIVVYYFEHRKSNPPEKIWELEAPRANWHPPVHFEEADRLVLTYDAPDCEAACLATKKGCGAFAFRSAGEFAGDCKIWWPGSVDPPSEGWPENGWVSRW